MRSAFALRIISGRTILNFGVQKRLRAFLNPIFTDGVVTENGICSAAFCESAALRGEHCQSAPSSGATRHLPPTGGRLQRQRYSFRLKRKACGRACSPERADFPRPGEDVTAGDKKGNLARRHP